MARADAIAAVSETIVGLLRDNYPRAIFGDGLAFELYQPKDFGAPMRDGVAICLWRITRNENGRNLEPRVDSSGKRSGRSTPVDLHYLIVPFAEVAERQQRLLGWIVSAMNDLGVMTANQLNRHFDGAHTFSDAESLNVIPEALPVTDYLTLRDSLHSPPPSASFLVRMLLIANETPLEDYPLTSERDSDPSKPDHL